MRSAIKSVVSLQIAGQLLLITAALPCRSATATNPVRSLSARPNVVLITIDTTRADRMGFLGSNRGLTPNLDDLARRATVFSRAYAQVPLTSPSHAVILTGTYPQFNHVNYLGDPLGTGLPYLPEIFRNHGYRTAAFVGALVLDPKKLAPGFERGFDVYDAGFHRRTTGEDSYKSLERRGEEVVNRAVAWLGRRSAGPFFLWIHLYDPHDPYTPPEPYRSKYPQDPYDGEIAYADSVIGKFLRLLKTNGLFDDSLIAVMSDHGEAFGEHGEQHHGIFLYDETIHVPLLFKLPRQNTGARVDTKVGLVDVAPSILSALHLQVPAAMQGTPIVDTTVPANTKQPIRDPDSKKPPGIYSESGYGHLSFGWSKLKAWRTANYLYIDAPERELYDQVTDPGANRNLAKDSRAVADTAASQMDEFLAKTLAEGSEKNTLTAEQAESLHALGYVGSDSQAPDDSTAASGPDPKDKIAIANQLYEAMAHTENARYQEAVPILEDVLKQEPHAQVAYLLLGRSYVALAEYQKAIAPLQHFVETTPDNSFAHYELGRAFVKTGQWAQAAPQFEAVVSQMPGSAMMHFYLALVYQRTSREDDSLKQFQEALSADPDHFPANLLLGRALVIRQRAGDAVPYLSKASKLRPDSIDAHRFLADAYGQLGKSELAERESSEAERLRLAGAPRLGTPGKEEKEAPVP